MDAQQHFKRAKAYRYCLRLLVHIHTQQYGVNASGINTEVQPKKLVAFHCVSRAVVCCGVNRSFLVMVTKPYRHVLCEIFHLSRGVGYQQIFLQL